MLLTLLLEYTVAAVRKLYKCQIGERLFTFELRLGIDLSE
jgi:hypothetical protein